MRSIILGTDWWTDCDDAVALRLLCRASKKGEISLRAVGINACTDGSVESVDGFLCAEGLDDVPVGIDLAADDFNGTPVYQKVMRRYARRFHANEEAQDAMKLYRRVLAQAESEVDIVEIGFMQVLVALLESGPDEISEKTGMQLAEEKIGKVWVMAGKWDEEEGRENNFVRNERARRAGHAFCERCPVPVTFLGWEIGADVITGKFLREDDPLHRALADHGSAKGRSSWDPMLIHLALAGDAEKAGYDTVRGRAQVSAETGRNRFERDEKGLHEYVVRKYGHEWYEEIIEGMIESA